MTFNWVAAIGGVVGLLFGWYVSIIPPDELIALSALYLWGMVVQCKLK